MSEFADERAVWLRGFFLLIDDNESCGVCSFLDNRGFGMPLTFFEFAQLALLASIAFLLMHEIVHRDAVSPYWATVIALPLYVAIPIAVILGFAWLVFAVLNWLFYALLGFAWLVPAGLKWLFSAL